MQDSTTRNRTGATPNGINIFGADQVTLTGNQVRNIFADGLRIGGGQKRRATNVTIAANIIDGAGYGNDVPTTRVPPYGIQILQADHIRLSGNTITNTRYPIDITGSTDVTGV